MDKTLKKKISNPVWHVHNGNPPNEKVVMPFSMLLNLTGSSNADNKEILWKFIKRFHKSINPNDYPILDGLTEYAINYFKDKVEPNKKFKIPNEEEKSITELSSKFRKNESKFKTRRNTNNCLYYW